MIYMEDIDEDAYGRASTIYINQNQLTNYFNLMLWSANIQLNF